MVLLFLEFYRPSVMVPIIPVLGKWREVEEGGESGDQDVVCHNKLYPENTPPKDSLFQSA